MDFLTQIEIEAIWLSLKISLWSMIWTMPLGLIVAWFLARFEFPGKVFFDSIIHLPLVLPPVVIGYVLLVSFGKKGFIGAWFYDVFGVTFGFSWRGAVIAASVMAFPLVVRAIRLSIEAVDQSLEAAARTLGAGPMYVFITMLKVFFL